MSDEEKTMGLFDALGTAKQAMELQRKEQELKYKIAQISLKCTVNEHDIVVSGLNPDVVFDTMEKVKKEAKKRFTGEDIIDVLKKRRNK